MVKSRRMLQKLSKIIFSLFFIAIANLSLFTYPAHALDTLTQCQNQCPAGVGPIVGPGSRQECIDKCMTFGTVEAPQGVQLFNSNSGASNGIGLIVFISNLIKLATIVAGLWVMINIILAGYTFITSSGDSSAYGKVKDKITMSVIGLIIIVAAYTITAIIGLLFFGDASYILSPNISGPTSTTTTP